MSKTMINGHTSLQYKLEHCDRILNVFSAGHISYKIIQLNIGKAKRGLTFAQIRKHKEK